MNVYAERRSIMDKLFIPPVSVEQFAAYLDGNLSESQMHNMDLLIATDPIMMELSEISDVIAEETQYYLNDDFALEADMIMLDEQDFDLPDIDTNSISNMNLDIETEIEVASTSALENDNLNDDFFKEDNHVNDIPEDLTIPDCLNNSYITEHPTDNDEVDTDFDLFTPNVNNLN